MGLGEEYNIYGDSDNAWAQASSFKGSCKHGSDAQVIYSMSGDS